MIRKKITEDFLQKEVWWWWPGARNHPKDFKEDDSLAFNYELVRRALRKERLQAFPAVAGLCRYAIADFGGAQNQQPPFRVGHPQQKGWMGFPVSMRWNLKLSDRALQKAFMHFVHEQRRAQEVSIERPQNRKSTREVPWRWLELMDLAHYRVRPLEDNERSSLSMARKAAEVKVEAFKAAVDQYGEQQRIDAQSRFTNWPKEFLIPAPKPPLKSWRGVWPTERKNR